MVRDGRVFGYVELDGGVGSGAGICDMVALVYGLVVARELVWASAVSTHHMGAVGQAERADLRPGAGHDMARGGPSRACDFGAAASLGVCYPGPGRASAS